MNYTSKSVSELKAICRERKIKGFSGKSSDELIQLIQSKDTESTNTIVESVIPSEHMVLRQEVILGDTITILPTLASDSAQVIIADPPYNIGKDFGNDSDRQPMDEYLSWCEKWIKECLRVLKPNGTMFIYGFSEILALILSKVPYNVHRRWIVWHYTE